MIKTLLLGSAALGFAAASILVPLDDRGSPVRPRQAACTNGPLSRNCWVDSKGNAFSINTDPETTWPQAGPTVTVTTLTVTKATGVTGPDGKVKDMLLINGKSPGPVITANWGDTLEITVVNNMADNGTSMHWHGISQKNSAISDGANGVTECPIPGNGGSRVYRFIANEHGTTWYHSHYSWQYGDGLVGTIVINGPASANYDIDLGTMPLSDLYYKTMFQANLATPGGPPADNIIINGTQKSVSGGKYNVTPLQSGKKHRLRLINTSVDTHFYVSLDSHTFQVIQADFVPINNYNTTWIFLAIGQRYDVIINANQGTTPGDYWFRTSIASGGCGSLASGIAAGKSIFRYNPASTADPVSTAATQPLNTCVDENLSSLSPVVTKAVPTFTYNQATQLLPFARGTGSVNNVVQWAVNTSSMNVDWSRPTLEYINNSTTTGFDKALNLYAIPETATWAYWIISAGGSHPIHLHGHDFFVLGSGPGTFSENTVATLNFTSPARRDVAMVSGGWLALAFPTDNPGAWLMHCHIAWHISGGLGVQFLERASEIKTTMDLSKIQSQCNAWEAWYNLSPYKKEDSGL